MTMIIQGDTKIVKTDKYATIFNMKTGMEISSGIDGYPDPFITDMPSLIDVGIMGHCENRCKICYQGSKQEPNMKLEDFKSIIDQCKDYTNQVALGGRGDPNLHENFEEIVKYARENYVVPNYTTSGINLTQKQIEITKKYCGSVAVSMYYKPFTYDAINSFVNAGVKTNVHWVISKETFIDIIEALRGEYKSLDKVNAIIFLMFKPKGNGENYKELMLSEEEIQVVIDEMRKAKVPWKIGTDSCTVRFMKDLSEKEQLFADCCEAARMSMYITPNMIMKPCSFMDDFIGTSIKHRKIKMVWDFADSFNECRNKLKKNFYCCPAID